MKRIRCLRPTALLLTVLLLLVSTPVSTNAVPTLSEESPSSVEAESGSLLTGDQTYLSDERAGGIREVTELREENVKHFALTNGKYTAVSYAAPVHRKDASGAWQDIDNSLALTTVKGSELYATDDLRVIFAKEFAAGAPLFSLNENGYGIGMSFISNQLDASASVTPIGTTALTNHEARESTTYYDTFEEVSRIDNRSSIVYTNVKANTDLEYVLDGNNVKENIIVKSAGTSYVYRFALSLSGLTATLTDAGDIALTDSTSGEEQYVIPAPYMYDANGEVSYDVAYTLTETGGGAYTLTVTASTDWINADGRAFPVTIDPTVTSTSYFYDTYISSSTPTNNYNSSLSLKVGTDSIAYIRFMIPSLPEVATISTAGIATYAITPTGSTGSISIEAYQMTENWLPNSITWNKAVSDLTNFGMSSSAIFERNISATTSPTYTFIDLTGLTSDWHDGTATNYGVAIKYVSGDFSYAELYSSESTNYPSFIVVYTDTIPNGVYAIQSQNSLTKWMTVENDSLWEGDNLQYETLTTSPTASIGTAAGRASLFKISHMENDRYIIRSMLNNNLSFDIGSDGQILTKEIPSNDEDVSNTDSFRIEWDGLGFLISPYYNSNTVITISSDNAANLTTVSSSSYASLARWEFIQYTGNVRHGGSLYAPISKIVGTQIVYTPIVWSTRNNVNTPNMNVLDGYTSKATGIWNATTKKFTVDLHDDGTLFLVVTIAGPSSSYTVGTFSSTLTLPIEEGMYLLKNVATQCFMNLEGPSTTVKTAIQQKPTYDTKTHIRWNLIHITDGYYRIQSAYSGLYVGIDSSDPYLIAQYSTENNRTLWRFDKTATGNYAIICKGAEGSYNAIASESTTAYYGEDLTALAYNEDSYYNDEWIMIHPKYMATVNNFYDKGYCIRHSESNTESQSQIDAYMSAVGARYLELLDLDITAESAQYFYSAIDQCKGTVTISNINSLCSCDIDIPHTERSAVLSDFSSSHIGNDTTTNVLWSCHKILSTATNGDVNENRSCSSGTCIYLLDTSTTFRDLNSQGILMHELNHQYGAKDHYHELTDNNNPDSCKFKEICSTCGDVPRPQSCIMNTSRQNITSDDIICEDCITDILTHLESHH